MRIVRFFLVSLCIGFCVLSSLACGEETEEPLITNVFVDTDIREALQDVAAQAGVIILPDETVSGYVTLELTEVPLSKALEMILAPGGYVATKMDGYYLVSSGHPESPAFRNMARSERINLKDLDAEEALALLPDFYAQYVRAIPGKRFITVTAPQPIIEDIKRILALSDVPRKQVMIDAVVTEISGEEAKNLGVEWGGAESGPYSLQFGELASIGGIFERLERVVATIHLLEKEGKARIRSNPRLVVLDGEEGEIRVTREEYYAIVTGTAALATTSLETISAGVILKVRPYVVEDGEILLTLSPEVSNVVGAGLQELPVVSRRIVTTTVRVKEGETLVLGGLRQLIEVTTEGKVPLLGDIPIIGALFRHKKTTSEDKDVVILITPRIL
ncbi:MAG: hypothetical protein ABDK93_05155 [Atribacterota bacterium]